jgi:acid stress-induced BolA-like protein IbaG/YrbA
MADPTPADVQRFIAQGLGDRMREQIHALSMKTLTPAEWASAPAATHHH